MHDNQRNYSESTSLIGAARRKKYKLPRVLANVSLESYGVSVCVTVLGNPRSLLLGRMVRLIRTHLVGTLVTNTP